MNQIKKYAKYDSVEQRKRTLLHTNTNNKNMQYGNSL